MLFLLKYWRMLLPIGIALALGLVFLAFRTLIDAKNAAQARAIVAEFNVTRLEEELKRREKVEASLRDRVEIERSLILDAERIKRELENADDPLQSAFDSLRSNATD
jgi:hypothetical protein